MSEPPDYKSLIPSIGLEPSEIPHILRAAERSSGMLIDARKTLASISDGGTSSGITIVAVGSIGRFEADSASDLDPAVIYDSEKVSKEATQQVTAEAVQRLKKIGFDVSEKTFAKPIELQSLYTDVGGAGDTNQNLTHRALLLTEGAWIFEKASFEVFRRRIFDAYRHGEKTRGRFLTSLSNDLHRYYRTLCVDYRFKIEEGGKEWAIRNIKLRHSRKTWHLSNLVMQCQASQILGQDEHDAFIMNRLGQAPLYKIASALKEAHATHLCRALYVSYDRFLEFMHDPGTRKELTDLKYEDKEQSPAFRMARANAEHLHLATAVIADYYYSNSLYRDYLLRYGLL